MKKILAISLGIVSLLGAANALALGGFSGLVPIGSVESDPDGTATGMTTYLGLLPGTGDTKLPTTCRITATQNQAILFDPNGSIEHVKQMTSIALAALLSGKAVNLHFTGTCGGQSGIYPKVDSITINN